MNPEDRPPPEWARTDEAALRPQGPPPAPEGGFAAQVPAGGEYIRVPFARPVTLGAGGLPPVLADTGGLPPPGPGVQPMRWWQALLEAFAPLAAAIIGSVLAVPVFALWQPGDDRWFNIAATATGGLVALAACIGLLKRTGQPLGSIGLMSRNLSANVWIGAGAYVLTLIALIMIGGMIMLLFPEILKHQDDAAQAIEASFPPMPAASMVAFMAFVAVWEEIAFRGFMLTRLQAIFRRWWLTIPLGAVLFGFGHAYQGPLAVMQTMLLGVVLGSLFWWRRSLVPGIVFHLLNNVMALLMLR